MKKTTLALLLVGLVSTSAFAQDYRQDQREYRDRYENSTRPYVIPTAPVQSFVDYARIREVTTEYDRVSQPRQVCTDEIVRESVTRNDNSLGGAAVGAVAGGLLGNQVGSGNGRTAATALGVIGGAMVGDNVGRNGSPVQVQERRVQHCRDVDNRNTVPVGYRVTYEYKGQVNSFVTRERPVGTRLKINLQATPDLRSIN